MKEQPKRGLGKGLSAILGEVPDVEGYRKPIGYVNKEIAGSRPKQDAASVLRIPVEMVQPNPFQPRMSFDPEALEELAASIRTLGLVQPITVRRISDGRYQIISGERRYRASLAAGLTTIPAYVREADDQGMLEMAIVENIQRENLDPIETAMSYQRLMDECKLTQEEMADRVGKKRASVANQLRLLKLPAKIQHDLKVGLISVGHAKVILGVDDEQVQQKLCDLVIDKGLNVRQLEEKVRQIIEAAGAPAKPARKAVALPADHIAVLERFGKHFEKGVAFKRTPEGKSTMTINFDSDEKVAEFLQLLDQKDF